MRDLDDREHRRLAVVAEAFLDRALPDLLDWLSEALPEVTALELGSGGYAPTPHCNRSALLADQRARQRWLAEIQGRGFSVVALNAWGNPLHPDTQIAAHHDRDLRDTIRLASALGVDRVVALAGCPAASSEDQTPYFAAGGWLPYLESVYDEQWERRVAPYWSSMSDFARATDPDLLICLELHPGTAVYNVETFNRLAGLGENLAATVDPSHFFWQQMDTQAVLDSIRARVGHVHAKDVVYNDEVLARQGLLDHRWAGSTGQGPWRFATVGAGHDAGWWNRFMNALDGSAVRAIAIEHEDLSVPAEIGVPEAARLLMSAVEVTA